MAGSQPVIEESQDEKSEGRNLVAGTKEIVEEYGLLAHSPWPLSLLIYITCPGMALPTVCWALSYQSLVKKMTLIDLPTDQSDEHVF